MREGTTEIPLSRGMVALVDTAEVDRLLQMGSWYAKPSGRTVYAAKNVWRSGKCTTIRMHLVITGLAYVDHINGDGLDNRRNNLRPATHGQNMANKRIYRNNSSGFKGVSPHRRTGKWQAAIRVGGRDRYLGLHLTPEEAAHAYDVAAIELFGDFAQPNFPKEQYL